MTATFQIPDALLARCVGREDLVQRVLRAFVDQMSVDIQQLIEACESGDAENTGKLAHRIKGASSNAEAEAVRALAEEVESLSKENRLDEAKSQIAKMETHWNDYVVLTSDFISE